MPTPIPEPVKASDSADELNQRIKALYTMNTWLDKLCGYTYATRSHIPTGVDSNEVYDAIKVIRDFINERPDWNNQMLKATFDDVFLKDADQMKEKLEYYGAVLI